MRLADFIAARLQKTISKADAFFAAQTSADSQAEVVCRIINQTRLRLWQVLEQAELDAKSVNVNIVETYLEGRLSLDSSMKELSHFLKCRLIEVTPIS
ncbi:hypothetical protein MFMK1_000190 [Metallumcola ferriviriculae]|uniref:Uncharacterized protein n=1 Tax=Metallumcola ferriviriculae TaxID=3039180 RepID=A0AAU0UGP3_9FIRM|nr:hypothetical protein MFMK1_000190 [Desulfitibacteraceae bacterium MK1]